MYLFIYLFIFYIYIVRVKFALKRKRLMERRLGDDDTYNIAYTYIFLIYSRGQSLS